eukprot:m.81289 g.81289  ORF g.81289 m.81289 type:complete len:1161 (-) comp25403_c0_seq3:252-3734(-)
MFIYLNKKIKIEIPPKNPIAVNALSWNKEQGWIVVGGDGGLLKVLRLESLSSRENASASSNLTMNQTLEGHQGPVQCVTWNEQYRKLTTSDKHGLIIVWMLYKGKWYEEMINNRNKSVVRDMKWNADGQKICIVYEDGAVIVGGVDGNRIWGKDVGHKLSQVAWSPDGKKILFGSSHYPHDRIFIYDDSGEKLDTVNIQCLEGSQEAKIASISWYNGEFGYSQPNCPTLCICFNNGRLQIMRHQADNEPIMVDTEMHVVTCQWNQTGTVLAIAGAEVQEGEVETKSNVVQFFTPFGDHLRTLKVPGNELRSLSWEGRGLRLTLAVDHFIYFANVRPDYKWGYFANTVVYSFTKPERSENCVVFWDTKLNGHQIKYVKGLMDIAAAGEHCVLSTKHHDDSNQYVLILCNAIGTPVDSKYIDVEPQFLTMTSTHIIVTSHNCVYIWAYAASRSAEAKGKKRKRDEIIFHIDDSPSSAKDDMAKFLNTGKLTKEPRDAISCISASTKLLVIGKDSGSMQNYSLPTLALGNTHQLNCRPEILSLNCDSSRVGVVDINGIFTLYDLDVKHTDPETGTSHVGSVVPGFERKDVWNVMWAKDNPQLFAIMERTYMYIFRGTDPEEPFTSNGWICEFDNLQVRSVLLDDVLKDPEHPTKECIFDNEIKALRDTRDLLEKVGIDDAAVFIEDNPHPRLWRLLAESALSNLDLDIADRAFVRCKDFQGIEFVKKLRRFGEDRKQKAEVAAYFHRFEEAEQIYLEMDRRDLAKQLRVKLGDFFRVVKLIHSSGTVPDNKAMMQAWNRIGDYYADRLMWAKAAEFYKRGGTKGRLAECYYMMESYSDLESMIYSLPENDPLLPDIGKMFLAVGMCEPSVAAYNKCGQFQQSIAACVALNQWDLAVEVAPLDTKTDIGSAYLANAQHLLKKDMVMDAIELYRKAQHYLDAAKLLYDLAAKHTDNPMRAKKLYVMAALQIEQHRDALKAKSDDPTRSALDGLLAEDSTTQEQTRMIDTAWRGAEAFHFLMLAQRQLYQKNYTDALRTAHALPEYDDYLDPVQAYSVLALAALACKSYSACSKAFTKLESLSTLTEAQQEQYESLALEIFTNHPPRKELGSENWPTSFSKASVVTGRPVTELEFWICGVCSHRSGVEENEHFDTCPLCYAQATDS